MQMHHCNSVAEDSESKGHFKTQFHFFILKLSTAFFLY